MAVVVTDNCLQCRFTECVTVCPVSCFHGDETMLYIDSEACIECAACIPVCPVGAIYDTIDLPDDKKKWQAINLERAQRLPVIDAKQRELPTAATRRISLGYR